MSDKITKAIDKIEKIADSIDFESFAVRITTKGGREYRLEKDSDEDSKIGRCVF